MDAAGLIILILALIGFGVGLHYAYLCLRPKPKLHRRIDPEHGPLILADPDVNGNLEEPSAPLSENEHVPLDSVDVSKSAIEPSVKIPLDSNSVVTSKPTDIVSPNSNSEKETKNEVLLTIEEEPIRENENSNLNLNSKSPESHDDSVLNYVSNTDEEDGLLQSRPIVDDKALKRVPSVNEEIKRVPNVSDESNKIVKDVIIDVPTNTPTEKIKYGWQTSETNDVVSDSETKMEKSTVINVEKAEKSTAINREKAEKSTIINVEKAEKKFIIPSKITVLPSVTCSSTGDSLPSSFPASEEEPPSNMDASSVAEPFYQPSLAKPTMSLAYHLSSLKDEESFETLVKETCNEEQMTFTQADTIRIDKLVKSSKPEVDSSKIAHESPLSNNMNETTKENINETIKVTSKENINETIKVTSKENLNETKVTSNEDITQSADDITESDTSEPEITEYDFIDPSKDNKVHSALANELSDGYEIRTTGFLPINPNTNNLDVKDNKSNANLSDNIQDSVDSQTNQLEQNINEEELKALTPSTNELNDSDSTTSSSSSSSNTENELERAVSEEIINDHNHILESDISSKKQGEYYVISNLEAINENDTQIPSSPTFEPQPTFYVIDSEKNKDSS